MGDSFAAERIGNLTAERICELLDDACSEWGVSSISEGMVTLTARDLDRMVRDAETRGRLAGLREAAAEAESRGDRYERHAAIAEPISADDFRAKAVACHRVAAAIRKLIVEADDD